MREIRFPYSVGLLYSAFTAYLGFEVNEGEYKVMGMAAYGKPRYVDKVRKLVHISSDGSYRLDLRYFAYHRSLRAWRACAIVKSVSSVTRWMLAARSA